MRGSILSLVFGLAFIGTTTAQVSPPEYTCYVRYDHDAAGNRTAKYWYCCCGAESSGTEPDTTGGQKMAQVEALLDGINLQLQPNPATDRLTVAVDAPLDAAAIEVRDMQGRVVITTSLNGTRTELDVRGLVAGPYLLHLMVGGELLLKQFLVQ